MFKLFRKRPVKFNIINAVELKPDANYIIFADESLGLNKSDIQKLLADLRKAGVRNVVSFMLQGSPDEAIQLISREKKHATKSSSHKHS